MRKKIAEAKRRRKREIGRHMPKKKKQQRQIER